MSDTWQESVSEQAALFEGYEVNRSEATLSAVNMLLEKDLALGERVTWIVEAIVTDVGHGLDKSKDGYLNTSGRKSRCAPISIKLVREDG